VGGTSFALSGTALGLVFGVLLNLILKEKIEYNREGDNE
jgi:xanthine/uracil permease